MSVSPFARVQNCKTNNVNILVTNDHVVVRDVTLGRVTWLPEIDIERIGGSYEDQSRWPGDFLSVGNSFRYSSMFAPAISCD